MQIKDNLSNYLQNRWIIGILKTVFLVGCLWFLYQKLEERSLSISNIDLPSNFGWVMVLVCLLMIVNWYLEALRWKLSIQSFEAITINKAWKAVLAGLALNWVLPFTSGDLIARIAKQQDKYKATSAAILNRSIMLFFTLVLGGFGASKMMISYDWNEWMIVLLFLLLSLIVILVRRYFPRFIFYYQKLSSGELAWIITISMARYLVFIFQFYLLLNLFLPYLRPPTLVAGIGWIFLIRSLLPLFFGGIGVREASGVLFLNPI